MFANTYLNDIQECMEFQNLLQYLPVPIRVKEGDNQYRIRAVISDYFLMDHPEILQKTWLDLYYSFLRTLAQKIIGRKEYFVFRLFPLIAQNPCLDREIELSLVAEIMVAPTRNVVIPEFIYALNTHTSQQSVIEWRCTHCQTINPITARTCGAESQHAEGCGASRAMLIQEL